MTVSLWRIAVEAPTYAANDLTGEGAKRSGGRWNRVGTPMVYSSQNIALAALETLAHLRTAKLPFNRYLVRIDCADEVWATRTILDPLPTGWDAIPIGLASQSAGEAWVRSANSALLLVPSVIVPDEFNVLINPEHPDASSVTSANVKRWHFDPRFFA